MVAEAPHRISEPSTPMLSRVNPSDPIRKPGLHNAITNPSYHRRLLRSWRSSMTDSAIVTPRAPCHKASRAGQKPAEPWRSTLTRYNAGQFCARNGANARIGYSARMPATAGCGRPCAYGKLLSMRGAPITVRCDCGAARHVAYGERWTCEQCGRRWNTSQIPAEAYWGIMREMRRYRLTVVGVAVAIAAVFALR